MRRIFIVLISVSIVMYLASISGLLLPSTKITLRVIGEDKKPIDAARASATFEVLGGSNRWTNTEQTDNNGLVSFSKSSTGNVGFSVEKSGYYVSGGAWHGVSRAFGRWQPWNPQIEVVLRKVVNPVPMYARSTKTSKLEVPVMNKAIGFDLIDYDWVAPYGKGRHEDFKFNTKCEYKNKDDYRCVCLVTFNNKLDGVQNVNNIYEHSIYKLQRLAPENGYSQMLTKYVSYDRNNGRQSNFSKDAYYIFRVRSQIKNGNIIKAMYGKIHGDIKFYPSSNNTAHIFFDYYLNPDYTNNLEFAPKQNLFTNIRSVEGLNTP